jgi:hypothetical protein
LTGSRPYIHSADTTWKIASATAAVPSQAFIGGSVVKPTSKASGLPVGVWVRP